MNAIAPTDRQRLKRDVERIQKHRQEKRDIGASEREIFAKLKSDGYNPKALRRLLALADLKDREKVESDMDAYRYALGMAVAAVQSGEMSLREAGHVHGVSKSSIHRALAVPQVSQTRNIAPNAGTWLWITAAREAHDAAVEAERAAKRERIRAEREALRARNAAIDADELPVPPALRGPAPENRRVA